MRRLSIVAWMAAALLAACGAALRLLPARRQRRKDAAVSKVLVAASPATIAADGSTHVEYHCDGTRRQQCGRFGRNGHVQQLGRRRSRGRDRHDRHDRQSDRDIIECKCRGGHQPYRLRHSRRRDRHGHRRCGCESAVPEYSNGQTADPVGRVEAGKYLGGAARRQ